MLVDVSTSLKGDDLIKALTELAHVEGIDEELGERLLKAHGEVGPVEPKYPAALELFRLWQGVYIDAVAWCLRHVKSVMTEQPQRLQKSAMPAEPLTADQLHHIQLAIRARFEFVAKQMQGDHALVTDEMLARWKSLGIVSQNVTVANFGVVAGGTKLIENAFIMGRLYKALEAGKTYEEILLAARSMPLLAPDLMSIRVAEARAGAGIQAIGEDVSKRITNVILAEERKKVREMTVSYFEGMKPTKMTPVMPPEFPQHDPAKRVEGWKAFSRELRLQMEPNARDWDRVAFYETQDAISNGRANEMVSTFGGDKMVYKQPMPTACPQCKFLYLDEAGKPRLFRLKDLIANGDNIGRKPYPIKRGRVSGEPRPDGADTLKPVAGQVHPWCQCVGPIEADREGWFR